ncbi:mitochondrial fission regulator 2 [Erpetoichthys calabaricus]|uniref:mitochondrial fission regulator 2 n=1 Tax=Erpetoichthys calabaricus TaxID=27687 RepID=UPI0022343758|nr:mitochondrial fission regulator 2 [Erpetoichthys calabaricus]
MSLHLDLLNILRCILEYFGVPEELLVPVWDSPLCGQYRSIIRMIGSNLPLTPPPRAHFRLVSELHTQNYRYPSSDASPAIASLADVLWVATDESENFVRFRNEFRPRGDSSKIHPQRVPLQQKLLVSTQSLRATQEKGNQGNLLPASTNTLKKITGPGGRAFTFKSSDCNDCSQPESSNKGFICRSLQSPSTPGPSPTALVLTSTPVSHSAAPPLAPPLPPTSISKQSHSSTVDLIKERRATKKSRRTARESPVAPGLPAMPSMLDVLKDINKVQLRAVERSPGGTPVMRKDRQRVSLSDPAALIADALKRKFAHRQKEDSFDKENRSFDASPFGSPENPKPSKHILKVSGNSPSLISEPTEVKAKAYC